MDAFEKASGRNIPYKITARRPGDIGVCYADPTKAKVELGWVAERGIEEMCEDSWRWQFNNPNGYEEETDKLIGIGFNKDKDEKIESY